MLLFAVLSLHSVYVEQSSVLYFFVFPDDDDDDDDDDNDDDDDDHDHDHDHDHDDYYPSIMSFRLTILCTFLHQADALRESKARNP